MYLSSTSRACTSQPESPGITVPCSTFDGFAMFIALVLVTWTAISSISNVDGSCSKDVVKEKHETSSLVIAITLSICCYLIYFRVIHSGNGKLILKLNSFNIWYIKNHIDLTRTFGNVWRKLIVNFKPQRFYCYSFDM